MLLKKVLLHCFFLMLQYDCALVKMNKWPVHFLYISSTQLCLPGHHGSFVGALTFWLPQKPPHCGCADTAAAQSSNVCFAPPVGWTGLESPPPGRRNRNDAMSFIVVSGSAADTCLYPTWPFTHCFCWCMSLLDVFLRMAGASHHIKLRINTSFKLFILFSSRNIKVVIGKDKW